MTNSDPKQSPAARLAYENTEFLDSPDGRAIRMLSEYQEPLARLRHECVQDTVVFFGSARFIALDTAQSQLQLLARPGGAAPAPEHEQPARPDGQGDDSELRRRRAEAAVRMARYYEDARQLAYLLTNWAKMLTSHRHRFVVASGGGPGIMEAANRGAAEAGGKTIGFNIRLPFEQFANPYITPGLNFEFHYFFMRKFWFAYLAKALIIFPGGFGTLDEMFECITLAQTHKLAKRLVILVYGSEYWKTVVNFNELVSDGVISPEDMELFRFVDTPEDAFAILRDELTKRFLEREYGEGDEQSGEISRVVKPIVPPENPELFFSPEITPTSN